MADMIGDKNQHKGFMTSNYGDSKFDKQRELNAGMSILPSSRNELENKARSFNTNGGEQ